MVEETEIGGPAREFPATRWTLILSSRDGTETRSTALSELLAIYWKPLYFFARRKGLSIESAKDAVQGFVAHLLERDFLARLDPARGRFRAYLRTALDHYLVNLHESASAQKRGGAVKTVPLDFELAERDFEGAAEKAEAAYDREWAVGVMERAMTKLRREFETGERKGPFELVARFFGPQAPPYAEAAKQSGLSVVQLKAFLHRARERFRRLVRDEVAHTVADPREADAEIDELMRALSS